MPFGLDTKCTRAHEKTSFSLDQTSLEKLYDVLRTCNSIASEIAYDEQSKQEWDYFPIIVI